VLEALGLGIKSRIYSLVIFLFLFIPAAASANAGVGVGTGKIIVNDTLAAGMSYSLPSMAVYNDGDEPGDYEMAVTFNERQPQLKPDASWVSFSPQHFTLAPNAAQAVTLTLNLPASAKTGDYYAYLEAHGVAAPSQDGVTRISTAAAAKFYFTAKNDSVPVVEPTPAPKKAVAQPTKSQPVKNLSQLPQFQPLMDQMKRNMSQS
jgi:hypothetical protein